MCRNLNRRASFVNEAEVCFEVDTDRLSYLAMFFLSVRVKSLSKIVNPRTQVACHIQSSLCALWEDEACRLGRDAEVQKI